MLRAMSAKHRFVTTFQKFVLNPLVRPLAGFIPGIVLLETTGRKTGDTRRNPVGGRREGNTLWIVAEQGRRANYVRNLEADPSVRVRIRGKWCEGHAQLVPDDDARRRAVWVGLLNGATVRLMGTELLTIRIELDPGTSREARA